MYVRQLSVTDFRSWERADLTLAPGVSVLVGANGQGKTNLLEAIYLLVTGRSFRTTMDREMIPWVRDDYDATVIRASV
ncbi:MAG TPA: AAA family ATPase, partial [Actinomycetospora sp.]|nr:AAA family ATPase [Actinomycetospora sp.]